MRNVNVKKVKYFVILCWGQISWGQKFFEDKIEKEKRIKCKQPPFLI